MFSKQYYKEIAEIINDETKVHCEHPDCIKKSTLIIRFCRLFAKDNPKFNRALFVKACDF